MEEDTHFSVKYEDENQSYKVCFLWFFQNKRTGVICLLKVICLHAEFDDKDAAVTVL